MQKLKFLLMFALFLVLAFPVEAQQETLFPTNGWPDSTPEEQGMDSAILSGILTVPIMANDRIHSMLVIRHGYVVLDTSSYLYDTETPHWQFSVTKSITATLVGIAIDQGYIESVDQSIWDFFPQENVANMDERKARITIAHLLTHTSGFDISASQDIEMYELTAEDQSWVQYVLDMPVTPEPGLFYAYRDANAHLISAILQQATGMSTLEFAQRYLFGPLGITNVEWMSDPQGVYWGGDGLVLSPYDMAKIGYLYLHQGMWGDQRIVSEAWVTAAATENHFQPHYWDGYGYFWYNGDFDAQEPYSGFAALGYEGQEIWVVPDQDLIVVTTGDSQFSGMFWINSFILPSITADEALPPNAEAVTQMQARIDAMMAPSPQPVENPETVQALSGQVFTLADNEMGWESVAVQFNDTDAVMTLTIDRQSIELLIGLDNIYQMNSVASAEPFWLPMGIGFPLRVPDYPVAARGKWISPLVFVIQIVDLSGRQEWVFSVAYRDEFQLIVRPMFTGTLQRVTIPGTAQ